MKNISTKIKSYEYEIGTGFYNDELSPKKTPLTVCLIMILNSVDKGNKIHKIF